MRRLALLVLIACSSPPARPLANASHAAPVVDDTATLANVVLARYVADPKALSDAGMLPAAGPIYVCAEIGDTPHRIPPAALPAGTRLALVSLADLQRQADRTNQPVAFIRFFELDVHGDSAGVSVGVDLLLPSQSKAIKMCCCSSSARWEKRGGQWVDGGVRVVSCS